MGADAWTKHPYEQKLRQRDKEHQERKRNSGSKPLAERAKDRWHGEHHKCACGCGKPGTMFRDRKMYNSRCVGRGSGWDKSGLPQDRTPPQSWRRRRELNRSSRELDREQRRNDT